MSPCGFWIWDFVIQFLIYLGLGIYFGVNVALWFLQCCRHDSSMSIDLRLLRVLEVCIAIHVLMVWGWGNAKPPPCQKAVLVALLKAVDMNRTSVWVCHCMLSMVQLSDWANKYWQSLTNDGLPSFSTSDIFQKRWSYPKGLPSHSNAFAWVCIAQLMWRSPVQLVTLRGAWLLKKRRC